MNVEPAMCRAARNVTRLRPLVATLALLAAAPAAGAQTAGPPGLHWEGVAFDPKRQRLVVFGGVTSAGTYLAETWAWDGRGWATLAESASSPGPRHAHAMGYDAVLRRVVLFGGAFESRDTTIPPAQRERALCDIWWLEDATWTRAADFSSGATESSRSRQTASASLAAAFVIISGRDPGTNSMLRISRTGTLNARLPAPDSRLPISSSSLPR